MEPRTVIELRLRTPRVFARNVVFEAGATCLSQCRPVGRFISQARAADGARQFRLLWISRASGEVGRLPQGIAFVAQNDDVSLFSATDAQTEQTLLAFGTRAEMIHVSSQERSGYAVMTFCPSRTRRTCRVAGFF
jgi:hypothetical protein